MRAVIHRLARSPYLNVFAAMALLGASGWEVVETLDDPGVGAHHGVVVYALFQLMKVFSGLFEGLKGVHEGLEEA